MRNDKTVSFSDLAFRDKLSELVCNGYLPA